MNLNFQHFPAEPEKFFPPINSYDSQSNFVFYNSINNNNVIDKKRFSTIENHNNLSKRSESNFKFLKLFHSSSQEFSKINIEKKPFKRNVNLKIINKIDHHSSAGSEININKNSSKKVLTISDRLNFIKNIEKLFKGSYNYNKHNELDKIPTNRINGTKLAQSDLSKRFGLTLFSKLDNAKNCSENILKYKLKNQNNRIKDSNLEENIFALSTYFKSNSQHILFKK